MSNSYIPKHSHSIKKTNNNNKIVIIKKKRRLKKWVWQVFIIIFLIIIIISFTNISIWYKENTDTSEIINQLYEENQVIEQPDDENTEIINQENEINTTNDYWYYIKIPLINVDIYKLKETNADTIGWINVNNTNINYPFVQANDNEYYLSHSFDKSNNQAGWIFLDYRNTSDFSSKNNIIYGHSRLNKTMFGSLHNVLTTKWYNDKDNHIIRLSTETENTMWQIFSVYKIEAESYYITTDFKNNDEYLKFLNTIKQRSKYQFDINLTTNDKILTLSTCYSDNERTVVHAKLIKRSSR